MPSDRTFLFWASAGLVCLPPALMGLVARKLTELMRDAPDHWASASELVAAAHIQHDFWSDVSPAILCAIVAVVLALLLDGKSRRLFSAASFGTLAFISSGFSCLWFVNLTTALNTHEDREFPTVSLMWGAVFWAMLTAVLASLGPRAGTAGRSHGEAEIQDGSATADHGDARGAADEGQELLTPEPTAPQK